MLHVFPEQPVNVAVVNLEVLGLVPATVLRREGVKHTVLSAEGDGRQVLDEGDVTAPKPRVDPSFADVPGHSVGVVDVRAVELVEDDNFDEDLLGILISWPCTEDQADGTLGAVIARVVVTFARMSASVDEARRYD